MNQRAIERFFRVKDSQEGDRLPRIRRSLPLFQVEQ